MTKKCPDRSYFNGNECKECSNCLICNNGKCELCELCESGYVMYNFKCIYYSDILKCQLQEDNKC